MRAVLDPNVLVSAVLSRCGAPAQIVRRWLDGEFELVVSELLLAELERALGYRKLTSRLAPDEAARLIAMLRTSAIVATDPAAAPRRSPDPGDDCLLALAHAERAVLVSGDQHLTGLAGRFPIQTPRGFLVTLTEQP